MKHKRLALLLASGALLAGCGTPQAGSAVVWDTGRITDNQVAIQSDALAADLKIPLSPELTSYTVNLMAFQEVVEQAAADAKVNLTQGEVQRQIDTVLEKSGGWDQYSQLLMQNGAPLTKDQLPAYFRAGMLVDELGKKVDPSTQPSQSSKLAQYLGQVSKQMGLQTNPRYGVWDASSLRVVSDANTLSQPGTNELTQMQQLQQQQGTP